MGLTFLALDLGNPADPANTHAVEFMVDSGAIYTVAPGAILKELGIQPLSEEVFWLANGEKVTRRLGIGVLPLR